MGSGYNNNKKKALSRFHIPVIMVITISLTIMATDIFLPSFPYIAKNFNVSDNDVQLYLTIFMLSSIISSFVIGPISDHYGRRVIVLSQIALFAATSFLCSIAMGHTQLLIFRGLQGFAAGLSGAIAAAAIQDIYSEKEGTKVRAYMGMAISLSPIIGPLIGGFIEHYLNWRYGFYLLSLSSVAIWFYANQQFFETLCYNKKTHTLEEKHTKELSYEMVLSKYKKVFASSSCLLYSIISPIFHIGALATLSVAPFYYQKVMGIDPKTFGLMISSATIGYMMGSMTVSRLTDRINLDIIIIIGVCIGALSMLAHIIIALTIPNSPYIVTFIQALYLFGFAMTFGPSMTKAMNFFPNDRGTTSSVANTFRQIFALLGTGVAYISNDDSFLGAAAISFIVLSLLIYAIVVQYRKNNYSK